MSNPKRDFLHGPKTNFSERKKNPQEGDSQTLFESQENIFQKISTAFSQSSNSTNIGEMEETLLLAMDSGKVIKKDITDCCSTQELRPYSVTKQPRKRILTEENCSIIKSPRMENPSSDEEDDDMEDCSQESVSMLEGLYQKNDFPELIETCLNSELEIISIYSDDQQPAEDNEEDIVIQAEKSTQTTFELNNPREVEIAKHANFIKSVVKLKSLLSSKEPVTEKKIWDILHSTIKAGKTVEELPEDNYQSVPKETIGYLIRSTDVDNVFTETVQALLNHLEYVFCDDFLKVATSWKNSVYEMAVEMISEVADCEVGVWKMLDSFLSEQIGSILKDAGKSKNFVLESKSHVIISLCQSTHLSYTAINFIIKELEKLKIINAGSLAEKISWAYQTKNSYYLLRILESSLNVLKDRVVRGKLEEVLVKKPEQKNYNVLDMWKKHWNKDEVLVEKDPGHDWKVVVSGWCTDLDEVLMHCVNYIPVISMAVERCGMLAKEILKLCHPEVMGK